MSEKLLPLNILLAATNSDCDSKLRNKLYATSWAFIYFMMDNYQRKLGLAKFIRTEQQTLCNVTDLRKVEKLTGISIKLLQRQFSLWVKSKLNVHFI